MRFLRQKTLMLYVTGGIKTPLLQSLVSEQWTWFIDREERQRGRLIWSQSYRQDQSGSFSMQGNGEEEEGVKGGWNAVASVKRWSYLRQYHQPPGRERVATWFWSCIAQGIQSCESVTVGGSQRRRWRRRDVELKHSSTLQTQPCVRPMCDCAIRFSFTARSDCGQPDDRETYGSRLPPGFSTFYCRFQT